MYRVILSAGFVSYYPFARECDETTVYTGGLTKTGNEQKQDKFNGFHQWVETKEEAIKTVAEIFQRKIKQSNFSPKMVSHYNDLLLKLNEQ